MAKQLNKQRLKQIERQLKRIDAEIRKRLRAEEALERQSEILISIPGISDVTAAGLIVHMPELGTLLRAHRTGDFVSIHPRCPMGTRGSASTLADHRARSIFREPSEASTNASGR